MAYTKSFMEQAKRLVTDRGYTPTAAARELGMPANTLKVWLDKAGWRPPAREPDGAAAAAAAALPDSDDPAVLKIRLKELEAENRRLRMEMDFLKKATAFFAKEHP